jgi:hypothetical protein
MHKTTNTSKIEFLLNLKLILHVKYTRSATNNYLYINLNNVEIYALIAMFHTYT